MRDVRLVLVVVVIVILAGSAVAAGGGGGGTILYQLAGHVVTHNGAPGSGCYSFTFLRLLDAGTVRPDGGARRTLELAEHPMTAVRAGGPARCFHVATPAKPIKTMGPVGRSGVLEMTDWEAPSQSIWETPLGGGKARAVLREEGGRFPGGLAVSPGNRYLVFPWVRRAAPAKGRVVFGRFDPSRAEGGLGIVDTATGKLRVILDGRYNRALFSRFAGFSGDGRRFYTVARRGSSFELEAVDLTTGRVEGFAARFPRFDGSALRWQDLFPGKGDFSMALFAISPDERRLVVTKDRYDQSRRGTACSCAVHHDLWIVPLDGGTARVKRGLPGYVAGIDWRRDGSRFVVASVDHCGCYPQYIDSAIDLFDRDGKRLADLVTERRSKITGARWSPDGRAVAYDVYGTDFVGRLKTVRVASKTVREVLNTGQLGIAVDRKHPVTILVAGWLR
ncbi:MAG TPA: hypothetical protein ENK19_09795 [Acidobacteria bacterium]|nr:hypothetical protein [Acidobacteriota bacterium]